jgi:hypothetical protein
MTNDIIDSLKDWFENEWLYERHLTSEFMKDKEAFKKGCEYFDDKKYTFKGELYSLLRKEAGLAEVARSNNNLEKYATHCFKQVEKVLSEFIEVTPGREKIGEYLLNNHDYILEPCVNKELNSSVSNLLSHSFNNSLNSYCLILKVNFIKKIKDYCYQAPDEHHHDEAIKSRKNKYWQLSQTHQEKIFKSILYFDTFGIDKELSENMKQVKNKPSLIAFSHMYHFRNLGSHLNSQVSNLNLPKEIEGKERLRLSIFYDNPNEVMNINNETPGFYQRYVDMVLYLYSEFFKTTKL